MDCRSFQNLACVHVCVFLGVLNSITSLWKCSLSPPCINHPRVLCFGWWRMHPRVKPKNCLFVIMFSIWDNIKTLRSRSSRQEVFCEKVFLETSQNSGENTWARVSFLIKLQAWTPFLKEHLWWLLLEIHSLD